MVGRLILVVIIALVTLISGIYAFRKNYNTERYGKDLVMGILSAVATSLIILIFSKLLIDTIPELIKWIMHG